MNGSMRWQRALIKGRVQGVAFRHFTRLQAEKLGVAGWVRNLPDGRVEALIGGDERQLAAMRQWLARGPAAARVDAVAFEDAPAPETPPQGFAILPTPDA